MVFSFVPLCVCPQESMDSSACPAPSRQRHTPTRRVRNNFGAQTSRLAARTQCLCSRRRCRESFPNVGNRICLGQWGIEFWRQCARVARSNGTHAWQSHAGISRTQHGVWPARAHKQKRRYKKTIRTFINRARELLAACLGL